ncbi:DivIVA domain-containing protein [Microbispora sp. NEAU-D428]|uniref:DivIVA domain-containing protein n=1 Tax=Microbispora sitophila TaxID=2771537 RepID=UPI0018667BAE|nr:DivIVA domain-containing protein [Microbispora sitophila]MBE3015408.1 DivIVA domain-containing protein [Microbispora sitophila]
MNRFPRVMAVRLGYDPEQVDDFVRRIERTLGLGPLDGPPVTADEIRNAKFAVKLGGYNETAVDFALDAFIVAVEARGGQDAASPPPPASESVAEQPAVEQPVAEEPQPAVSEPAAEQSAAEQAPAAPSRRTRAEKRTRPQTVPAQASGRGEKTGTPPPEPGTPSWLETQAARVERVAFRPGRLGMGYREEEVDAFLDRVVATLRGTAAEPLTPEQVRKATFATVVFRPGYAIHEVDGFLAEMAGVLERFPCGDPQNS